MAMFVREVPCDICETVEDVNNFCINCKQKFCDNCKKGHLKSAFAKHHKFAPIGDSLLASSQNDDLCTEHKEEYQFYCRTCSRNCCSACLIEYHKSHDLSLISRLVDDVRSDIEEKLTVKEKDVANVDNVLEKNDAAAQNCHKQCDETVSYIKKTIHGWMTDLKALEDELIEETKRATKKETEAIELRSTDLRSNKEISTRELQEVRRVIRTRSNASLLQEKGMILSKIDSITVPLPEAADPVLGKVTLRQSTREQMRHILQRVPKSIGGVLSETMVKKAKEEKEETRPKVQKAKLRNKMTVTNGFKAGEGVFDIALVSESKAWIGTTNKVMLMNIDGEILLQRPHGNSEWGTSVTSTTSGAALYVSSDTVISTVDQTGTVSKVANIKSKKINCIRYSKTNNVIYVGTDRYTLEMSLDGREKRNIKCAALALTELTNDKLVAINTEKDIVVLNKDGSILFLRNSIEWDWGRFSNALTVDCCGSIVVGNPLHQELRVYELTGDNLELQKEYTVGKNLRTKARRTRNDHGINSVMVDRQGRLWIGTDDEGVLIAEYSD